MRFIAVHSPTAHADCRMVAQGIAEILLVDEYGSAKGLRDTLESYCQLNNLGYSAELCAAGVELSCTHGVVTTFTIIN